MKNLTDLIREVPLTDDESVEDIFASAPGFLFTDDLRNQHGDPGATIIYKSRVYGAIELQTADPVGEDERQLFSHYLWNAGVLMAERISGERMSSAEERERWRVQGRSVLELGAGVGLCGIVSSLAGAKEVEITDYPAPVVLANINRNVMHAIPAPSGTNVSVHGHEWGTLDDEFSVANSHRFDRILAADCYWMPGQHCNLARSMLNFLSLDPDARVLAIAGFHTGRAKLANFWDVAVEEGLAIELIYEEDASGQRREWAKERDGGRENPTERKKWLAIAVLKRADATDP